MVQMLIFMHDALSHCHTFMICYRKDPGYIKMSLRDSQNQRDDVSCKLALLNKTNYNKQLISLLAHMLTEP